MTQGKKLKHIKRTRNTYGQVFCYFNKPGHKTTALPGEEGSPEFMAAYQTALAKTESRPVTVAQTKEGTFGALLKDFYKSRKWASYKENTQSGHRRIYENARVKFGAMRVKDLTKRNVQVWLDSMRDTPGALETFHKRMNVLFDFAVDYGYFGEDADKSVNPFRKVPVIDANGPGFIAWTDEEIARFKKRWPSGTRQRLAMCLLLYTTQRRSDVHRMGKADLRDGDFIYVEQVKHRKDREKTRLTIPIHPELKVELAHVNPFQQTFILTDYGKAFSPGGFTNWFVEQANLAGLSERTPHGLRKAGSRHLAEGGASAMQIAAITGHKSLSEVELYVRSADQKRLAQGGMKKVSGRRRHKM
jgi:integrase